MFTKYLCAVLCCMLLITATPLFVSAQTDRNNDSSIAKVKAEIIKRSTSKNKSVKLKMLDGKNLKGDVTQTGEDSFTLTNSKTNQSTTIAYQDVAQVKGNGLSTGAKIGIIAAVAGAAAVVLGIFIKRYCNEQAC